ncbi:DUF1631 family protein [Massilia sp. S19_KUP03_FR1]|uniref:DUF1631 family protein n=1 Tax=Massilia sp. S19_KUP03_FR1 TaxID=3025503 RepID=UPI002FCDBA80
MQNTTKHIVRLAQRQALSSFAELVADMLVDTNAQIGAAVRAAPASEQAALGAARNWLYQTDRAFRETMLAKFSTLLERAMETMHTDLRAALHDIRADNLSLVDDDVMTRQIELDRLAVRLRDVDEISLGRINLTIASLHGVSKVRERENPFRPYLAARALYETVREMVREPAVAKVLFDYMAGAIANRLPGYYAAILGHFQARGLDARLLAQPSEMTREQRERLSAQYAPGGAHQVQGLQELVWQVLDQQGKPRGAVAARHAAAAPQAPAGALTPQRARLDAQLRQLQHERLTDDAAPAPSPLALSEQIGEKADPLNRVTIDLVGLVFDYILREELLPQAMRILLGRLHVPFLRAAVLDPALLQESGHPARSLLDRLGTLGAAMLPVPGAADMPALRDEASRLVERVRQGFDTDVQVFSSAERELDTVVSTMLARSNPLYTRLRDAVAAADASDAQLSSLQKTLTVLLAPLQLDPRLATFIDTVWIKVMLHQGDGAIDAALLPELIWSAQEKAAPADRSVLMRALPTLVRRVREGIALLGLSPAAAQAALDQLAAVHMDVLGQRVAPGGRSMSLDWLHVHFAPLQAAAAPSTQAEPLSAAALEAALAGQGLSAVVHSEPVYRDAMAVDEDWLGQARPGARFETLVDGRFMVVRLETVDAEQSAFIFSTPVPALPLVYRRNALLAAMHTGTLRPVEYAPLFQRAVSASMAGLGALAPA